jgi:hypothetical protein
MADKLLFRGDKHIRNQEGDEMSLVIPRRGGDTHNLPRWWSKSNHVVNIKCAVLRVQTASRGTLRLVIPLINMETVSLWIIHEGDGTFRFLNNHVGVERVAVFSDDMRFLYEEYQFPKISGGSVLRRTILPLPTDWTIGTVTLSGPSNAVGGTTETYTATNNGNADDVTYVLTSDNANDTISGMDVTFEDNNGTSNITVTGTSALAGGATAQDNIVVTVTASVLRRINLANFHYDVAVFDDGNGNDVFALNGNTQADITASAGDSIHFDLSDASLVGHPFRIYTDSSKTTEVTVGVEFEGDSMLFTPPIAGTFVYECQNHAGMGGTITVS